ncbi:hypothetical protein LCGC14_0740410 [marine sediment metagenome]|uniref:Uncharacterized protein n=1 Tax=marine sediment metagenome TaxID=412755 RepID=A0A0F9QRV6_9ZZZZ
MSGFTAAQAAYDAQEPLKPLEPTSIDVTFKVRMGLDMYLKDYLDEEDSWPVLAAAMAFVKKEMEGHIQVTGNYNGDRRDPMSTQDIEIFDFDVKWIHE